MLRASDICLLTRGTLRSRCTYAAAAETHSLVRADQPTFAHATFKFQSRDFTEYNTVWMGANELSWGYHTASVLARRTL